MFDAKMIYVSMTQQYQELWNLHCDKLLLLLNNCTPKLDNRGTEFRSFLQLVQQWCGARGQNIVDVNNLKSLSAVRRRGGMPLHRFRFNSIKVIRDEMSEQKQKNRSSFIKKYEILREIKEGTSKKYIFQKYNLNPLYGNSSYGPDCMHLRIT